MITKTVRVPERPKKPRKATPRRSANIEVVSKAVTTWDTPVLQCRLLGHSWQQYQAEHITRFHYWHVVFRCDRGCGVEKWEEWTEQGLVAAKGMIYPKDQQGNHLYLLEGVGYLDADTRGVLRLETLTRFKFTEVSGGPEDDADNVPRSSLTVAALKKAKQWPL